MPQVRQGADVTSRDTGRPAARDAPAPALALIAAMARNRVIGRDNRMPWHLPADLKRFRALTTGHRVIMGRKTFESLGKPLSGRENVVVSRAPGFVAPGCRVVASLAEAVADPPPVPPMFCVGGGELYAAAIPLASEIYLTVVDADFAGDAVMPEIPADEWREDAREEHVDAATGLRYAFVHLTRIAPAAPLALARPAPI